MVEESTWFALCACAKRSPAYFPYEKMAAGKDSDSEVFEVDVESGKSQLRAGEENIKENVPQTYHPRAIR